MNYEERFWALRENCERAHDRMMGNSITSNQVNYVEALTKYQDFCMDVLEMLVDENPDILQILKAE